MHAKQDGKHWNKRRIDVRKTGFNMVPIYRGLSVKKRKSAIGVLYTRTSYTIVTEAMWVFGVQRVLNGLV